MSYYDDERSRRYKGTRERRRDDYEDSNYDARDAKATSLVRRRDDSTSSTEEVTRDFPPGERGGAYYRETTVRKQGHRPIGRSRSVNDDYFDDRYDDRSSYGRRRRDDDTYVSKRRSRGYDSNRDRRSKHYSSYSDSSRSRSRTPPRKDRRKSTTEEVLKSLGLGGVAGAILGKSHDRSRSRSRDRARSRGGRRDRSSSDDRGGRRGKSRGREQVTQAIKAALLAGATEAVRARKEPGGWGGEKGKRVLTTAISAGGVDGLISSNRDSGGHQTRDLIGSVLAGLATNRIVNGPRSKSRGRTGSPDGHGGERGRSQSRGLGDLVAGGALAATGKKLYDSVRSRSRGREREHSRSSSESFGSRSPPRRKRSQSVSAGLAKGLSAIGLKDVADKVDPERRGSKKYDDYYDDRNGGYRDSRDVRSLSRSRSAGDGGARSVSVGGAPPGHYQLDYGPHHTGDPATDSDSDLGSSSGEEKKVKRGRKKQYVSVGLASVATIHAAHNVYQSMEKRNARHKAVKEGDISTEQARREKNKNRMQDVASIGIAALGIKGAYSEWKEMKENREEMKEQQEKLERHRAKREARRQKLDMLQDQQYRETGYATSMPNLAQPDSVYGIEGPHASATHYYDDNPYSAMGPPPPHQQYIHAPPPRSETH